MQESFKYPGPAKLQAAIKAACSAHEAGHDPDCKSCVVQHDITSYSAFFHLMAQDSLYEPEVDKKTRISQTGKFLNRAAKLLVRSPTEALAVGYRYGGLSSKDNILYVANQNDEQFQAAIQAKPIQQKMFLVDDPLISKKDFTSDMMKFINPLLLDRVLGFGISDKTRSADPVRLTLDVSISSQTRCSKGSWRNTKILKGGTATHAAAFSVAIEYPTGFGEGKGWMGRMFKPEGGATMGDAADGILDLVAEKCEEWESVRIDFPYFSHMPQSVRLETKELYSKVREIYLGGSR